MRTTNHIHHIKTLSKNGVDGVVLTLRYPNILKVYFFAKRFKDITFPNVAFEYQCLFFLEKDLFNINVTGPLYSLFICYHFDNKQKYCSVPFLKRLLLSEYYISKCTDLHSYI